MTASDIFQAAFAAHRAGRLAEAEQGYLQLLQQDGHHADALHLLGVLALQSGNFPEAVRLIEKALAAHEEARYFFDLGVASFSMQRVADAGLALRRAAVLEPQSILCAYHLGYQCMQTGLAREAERQFRRVLAMQPEHAAARQFLSQILQRSGRGREAQIHLRTILIDLPDQADALHLLALSYIDIGELDDAERTLRSALAIREDATMLGHMGNLLSDQHRIAEAQRYYRCALVYEPAHAIVHFNYGRLLQHAERIGEAESVLLHVLAIAPEFADADLHLGLMRQQARRYVDAEFHYRRALLKRPDFISALVNLAEVLKLTQHRDEAERQLKIALAISPAHPQALNNLGVLYGEIGRRDEAGRCYRRVLAVDPHHENIQLNLAHLHQELQQYPQAEHYFKLALAADAANPQVQFNYGLFLLLQGDYPRGWQHYEIRWKTSEADRMLDFVQPRWLGTENIDGKTILLHAEQGQGDTLQFVRYVSMLHAQGAKVLLQVPSSLVALCASCPGVDSVVATGDSLPTFDFHSPLMSLPLLCGTTVDTIPAAIPYLFAHQDAIDHWRNKLGATSALHVGLVWAGASRREQASAHLVDKQRSMHFRQLLPLLDIDGIAFHSLQVGDEARAQLAHDGRIADHGPELRDFADTAALVANLDLVICVDTSIAHLVGALGKPFWLLNRYNTCWRWLTGRSDSPWYPSARLFRQSQPGNWNAVIDDVKRALREWVINEGMNGH